MKNQHAWLSKLLLLLLFFYSSGVYAQADKNPQQPLTVEFGSKFKGNAAGYVFGTIRNNSTTPYPCVQIEFNLSTRFDLRPRGQAARQLGVLRVEVHDLQPRHVRDYQQPLPFPAGIGLKSITKCPVQPSKALKPGVYTIRQKSNGRYVDAYTNGKDFALMTRPAQDYVPKAGHTFFEPPTWVITAVGDAYTIQQKTSGRFVDAHEIAEKDFAVVTRPVQNFDETQKWLLMPLGDNTFTIQQKSSGRFLDAYEVAKSGFAVVTRPAQNDDTQRWIISEFFPEG